MFLLESSTELEILVEQNRFGDTEKSLNMHTATNRRRNNAKYNLTLSLSFTIFCIHFGYVDLRSFLGKPI